MPFSPSFLVAIGVSFVTGMLVPYKTQEIKRLKDYPTPTTVLAHVVCTQSTPDCEFADYQLIDPATGVVFMEYLQCIAKKKVSTCTAPISLEIIS